MFVSGNRLFHTVGRVRLFPKTGKSLFPRMGIARYEHTTENKDEEQNTSIVNCDDLCEIYKGKVHKLEYNDANHQIQTVRNSLISKGNFTVNELKTTARLKLTEIFLPKNYPQSVKGKYLNYCTFASLGMGLSAAGGVLSTQSMLVAVGMGAGAVPMAAALNWVLKDGLGQLGGMAFTAIVNSRLDADSRGWRILTAWLLEISTWMEVMTPLFPRHFLLLATMANVGKNISWLAGSATRAGIRYGFVNAHNMSDLTAKEGSQTTCVTVFGTFLGILLSNLIGAGHMEYILMSSMSISAISLFCIHRSLHCVSLPTLNYQRGEIVTSQYLQTGEILTPEAVASKERYYLPYLKVKGETAKIPVVVGVSVKTTLSAAQDQTGCSALLQLFKDHNYVLSYCKYKQGLCRSIINHEKRTKQIIGVALKKNASAEDQMTAYLHAHLLRQYIGSLENEPMSFEQQMELIKKSMAEMKMKYPDYKQQLMEKGWNCNDLFLEERSQRYYRK